MILSRFLPAALVVAPLLGCSAEGQADRDMPTQSAGCPSELRLTGRLEPGTPMRVVGTVSGMSAVR